MIYNINWQKYNNIIAVPRAVVDDYIKLANGKSLAVLLYIIANNICDSGKSAEISSALGNKISAEDVEDAFSFWSEVGILNSPDDKISVESAPIEKKKKNSLPTCESIIKFLPAKEIANRISTSDEIAYLLRLGEESFGRLLNHTEQRTLIFIYDYYAIPLEVLQMIFELCKSINRLNIAYIEKLAKDWNARGILTLEKAEEHIIFLEHYFSLEGQVAATLNIKRGFTAVESAFIEDWNKHNVSIELIEYAYEKSIPKANGSFNYMNKIILTLLENNIHTVDEAKLHDEMFVNSLNIGKKSGKNQNSIEDNAEHSYDLEKILESALNKYN